MNDQPQAAPQSPAAQQQTQMPPASPPQTQNPEPVDRSGQPPAGPGQAAPGQQMNNTPPPYGVPPQLVVKSGTYVNMRINQMLSSDKSHVGDTFSGTLTQPVIADGIVVAPRGAMVYGRVVEAEKAHDGKDSRLGLELNSITLVDGTQASVGSRLIAMRGPTTPRGIEAGTIVGTTATGAAIGGIAGRGTGAAIGAGVGAMAGAAAVIMTHNHPTVVYPETAFTFALTAPVSINTTNAPQAYRYVGPEDYYQSGATRPGPQPGPGYGYAPAPYPYYYSYPYPYYPYYWGPGFGVGVFVGPRFGWGFGRGFGRRW